MPERVFYFKKLPAHEAVSQFIAACSEIFQEEPFESCYINTNVNYEYHSREGSMQALINDAGYQQYVAFLRDHPVIELEQIRIRMQDTKSLDRKGISKTKKHWCTMLYTQADNKHHHKIQMNDQIGMPAMFHITAAERIADHFQPADPLELEQPALAEHQKRQLKIIEQMTQLAFIKRLDSAPQTHDAEPAEWAKEVNRSLPQLEHTVSQWKQDVSSLFEEKLDSMQEKCDREARGIQGELLRIREDLDRMKSKVTEHDVEIRTLKQEQGRAGELVQATIKNTAIPWILHVLLGSGWFLALLFGGFILLNPPAAGGHGRTLLAFGGVWMIVLIALSIWFTHRHAIHSEKKKGTDD